MIPIDRMEGREREVILRHFRPEDWRQVSRWEQDDETLSYIGKKKRLTASPWGLGDIPSLSLSGRVFTRRRLMAIDTPAAEFIGYVELREINWRRRVGELRICIGEKHYWGQGFGTAAVKSFVSLVFGCLKVDYIYLRVYRSNVRALRCYEKCGFRVEGILRMKEYDDDDIILMGIRRSF